MKRQSFQRKRRSSGGGGLFVFHTKTKRRKKQRVAASADLGSEVPNLGVARALFVILVLHVAAIAAIFIHNRATDEEVVATGSETKTASAVLAGQAPPEPNVDQAGEDYYFVATGDTYDRIARARGVDVNELRDLNDNKPLGPGRVLRIPSGSIAPPAEFVATTNNPTPEPSPAPAPAVTPVAPTTSAIVVSPNIPDAVSDAGNSANVYVRRSEPTTPLRVEVREATQVRPNRNPVTDSAGAPGLPATRGASAPAAIHSYTVKSGDTAWGIAKKNGISVKSLLDANNIKDARKLHVKMELRIPAR